MTDIQLDVPIHVTHHPRGRRQTDSKVGLASRLQAAFGAFLAPEKFQGGRLLPASNDNATPDGVSLADPLALPPDWHAAGDLLSLSFLPFER
ncbi:MAG: hypothetical protein OJJ21_20550 [Ferrovibrio sp.]|uniref:hypothetical protein n=1 Tax=Ferrovibrio sp. TaxID=1917215 RepID=UPI00262671FF|nr:hypothetical protein [Ferrovibrio sp.]MCW0235999.1 hypothetical protein [Ferrovibrio sp.]